jgi:uncharacterized cupredoxin-like copper-binding protein
MTTFVQKLTVGLAALSFAGFATAAFAAPSVIKVTLFDLGSGATMATDLGMTMGGVKSKAVMKIAATPAFAKAGDVTFEVTNNSKDLIHEMIVVKLKDQKTPLPYVAADNKVNEDAAGHLGEVSELDPSKTGALTLKLDAGTYMIFCNLPGHYMAGMWTTVTVK